MAAPTRAGPEAETTFATGLAATGGSVGIRDASAALVDGVGWGTGQARSSGTAGRAGARGGPEPARHPDGHDTNENAADFSVATTPTPRAANQPREAAPRGGLPGPALQAAPLPWTTVPSSMHRWSPAPHPPSPTLPLQVHLPSPPLLDGRHRHAKLDGRKLRADFPILEQEIHGKPFAYLDSAVTSQKPRQVLDAMTRFYETSYGNVHRGVYTTAERADAAFVEARKKVQAFLNAPSAREVIFTRNATEALNLVAYAWGLDNLGPGDVVVSTELEHHSNFVPWQYIAQRTGARFALLPVTDEGEIDLDRADEAVGDGTVKAVAYGLISNSIGTINPVRADRRLGARARRDRDLRRGAGRPPPARRRADARRRLRRLLRPQDAAPTGIGALWGRAELLERMSPFILGGSMIRKVTGEQTSWNELPYKFEGGTPAFAEAVALGAAIDYLEAAGLEAIEAHEHELTALCLERLADSPVTVYGPGLDRRGGIVSFNVEGVHPHDVAQVLDGEGVAIRAGHHCTQPLLRRLGVPATNRASFYLYSLPEEVERLAAGLVRVNEIFNS